MPKHLHQPMRFLSLCLTFACGSALADELFRYTPAAALSENQVSTRNHLALEQGFKSITPIEINKAALNSNVITLTVKDKTYRLEGKLTQGPPFPLGDTNGKILRMVGQVTWSGRSADGFGSANYSDLGNVSGDFTLGGMVYRIVSNEGMNGFLVEIEPESAWPDPLFHPPYMPPTLTAKQEKVRDHWAKQPQTISVTTVQVNKAAPKSNVVTLTIKGKRYRFDGKWTRTEPYAINEGWTLSAWMGYPIVVRSSSMRPGLTSWYGQGSYGSGNFSFHDEGEVSGSVTITKDEGRGYYNLVSAGDLAFLVEYDRMAQRKTTPEEDPIARKARLEAEVAQRAAEERILRTEKGESLFAPAKEASLNPQFRSQLDFAPADKASVGLFPIHVNRLAIDAPVTVIVIDGKEYRFVGKVSITRPPPGLAKPVSGYWAVTDAWDGHTSSGDRAKITRDTWSMSGQIDVGGRHFSFGTRGEFGLLYDLNPTLVAERNAEEQRARQKAIREAAAKWRAPSVPFVPVETPVGMTKPLSPAAQVLPNAQPCEQKTGFLSGLDEADSFSQPVHLRSAIAELRATVKAEMRELRC
jgi:hypothetical protein